MATIAEDAPLQVFDSKRRKALIFPREHGAWGILLIPLVVGALTALLHRGNGDLLLPFAVSAFSLFWLRTPIESLLGNSAMAARGHDEKRLVRIAIFRLGLIAAISLTILFWNGENLRLVYFGVAAGFAFLAQAVLKKRRKYRVAAEIVGAVGLASTGPAAYLLSTGEMGSIGWTIWIAHCLFAANQIHFVQTRIRTAKTLDAAEKFGSGWGFFVAQATLITALAGACVFMPQVWPVTLAFLPALFRGFAWFLYPGEPLKIHALGWSELRQSVLFGILLAIALSA